MTVLKGLLESLSRYCGAEVDPDLEVGSSRFAASRVASLAWSLSRYSGANLDPDLEVGSSRFAASRAASLASLILKETLFPHQLLLSPSSANPLKIHGKRQPYLAGFFWKYGFFWCHWDYSAIFSSILLLSIC